MRAQRYCSPESAAEAVALLGADASAAPFTGGTDLLVQMRARLLAPATLVDLKRIPGIDAIELASDAVRIGAAVRCCDITAHPELRRLWPGLVESAGLIGSAQVQGRASLGGNLCNASPAADSVPALVANGAQLLIEGPNGARRVAVEAFPRAPGRTALEAGEFLRAIELPRPGARTADAYLRFTPRTEMDIAVAGAAVALSLDVAGRCMAARVALGAVAPTVLLVPGAAAALLGSACDGAALQACVAAARAAARPITDKRGTAELRRHVVGVLARRAVLAAVARARAA